MTTIVRAADPSTPRDARASYGAAGGALPGASGTVTPLGAGGRQSAPVSLRNASTAASSVGKKWSGSSGADQLVALELRADRVLELGEHERRARRR